jgi:hypothetical protein
MNGTTSVLCSIVAVFISGCQLDAAEGDKDLPEVVVVSEQMSDTQNYNVDLTRDDAIYVLAPELDASRLSVTCPSRVTISFSEYITTRLRSAGVMYDPMKDVLRLTNAVVSPEFLSSKYDDRLGVAASTKPCVYDCFDAGVWEQCINRDC